MPQKTKTGETIVVVDDEQRMCDSLAALLTGDGYQVQAFQDPTRAADAIRSTKIDLVITDIKMPKMSGLELLNLVKDVDDEVPVILMTGYASMDTAITAVSRGAYDYLMKPIEFSDMELAVKRALDKRRSALERRRLLERLKLATMLQERRIGELNALYEAGKSIGSAANLQELLRQIVALASSVTEARVGSIMLLDEREERLTIEAAIGLEQDVVERTCLEVGDSIAGHVAQTGEPVIVEDIENDPRFKRVNRERYGEASLLCAPLKIKNKVIGVINMANKETGTAFTQDDLKLLVTFASQAAVAVDDANQFEKNRRRLIEFQILHEVSAELPNIKSISEFRRILIDKLRRVFPVDYTLWFNWDGTNELLILEGATGADELPGTDTGSIDLARVARDSIVVEAPQITESDITDHRAFANLIAGRLDGRKSFPSPGAAFMAVPILKYGELSDVFCLGTEGQRPYQDDDFSLASLVVSQAALLFEKERSLLNATRLLTMGNMISEISHDLKKPLTSIKGALDIVKKRHPDVCDSDLLPVVDDEIRRMNELVRELVDFSKPDKYETEKVDLRQLVERAGELVGPDLRKRKIDWTANFEQTDWEIIVNKNQILEALLNLFINAIDAMPDGGRLGVHGLVERPDHKKVDYLALKISDTGHGIPRENLSKVFDRYFTSKETGTGLGLAVVERIISAHSGTLSVASEQDQGTTFTVYFPL